MTSAKKTMQNAISREAFARSRFSRCDSWRFCSNNFSARDRVFRDATEGPDMVLGMDWLIKLGNIEANFDELCLKWKLGGQKYRIQGDPALCTRQVS